MTTIVNTTTPTKDSGGLSLLIGVVATIGFFILFIYFGIPAIRNMSSMKLNVPAPQIAVPGTIDVNLKQSK